jgi:hypothetical protein
MPRLWGELRPGTYAVKRFWACRLMDAIYLVKDKNRKAARKLCRSRNQRSCDEFPFASTKQGCHMAEKAHLPTLAITGYWCSTAGVPLADNMYGGSLLSGFYRKWRVRPQYGTTFDGDRFSVFAYDFGDLPIVNT